MNTVHKMSGDRNASVYEPIVVQAICLIIVISRIQLLTGETVN